MKLKDRLNSPQLKKKARTVMEYTLITLGALIMAANVPLFLAPNLKVSSGVTGLGMLANYLWGWPIGLVTLAINIPLLVAGVKWGGGWRVFVRTIYAVVVYSVAIDVLSTILPPIKSEPLLYTLFGGVLDGIGIGLVLRGRGTSGGSDIVALLLSRYRGVAFGNVLIVINGAILLGSAGIVGVIPVLYALVVNYIAGRVVDFIQEGAGYARAAWVITDKYAEVREKVFAQLGRGVTMFEARGGYTEIPRPALFVVVHRTQVIALKQIIADIDPQAFVVVAEAHEVLGEGFHPVIPPA